MTRNIKKTILTTFMFWHYMVLICRYSSNNVDFIMADRPWWVVKTLACFTVEENCNTELQTFLDFLVNEANKELWIRERQVSML